MLDAGDGTVPPGIGAIVVGHFPLASGEWIAPHSHTHHQLAWTRRGVVGVAVGDAHWVLPPTRALWLPAGVVHRTSATRKPAALIRKESTRVGRTPRHGTAREASHIATSSPAP
ncbi:AraC family ligand binding domain-containing protein [Actinomadura sp. WAC 06369]|uniref:AraC family ligand binding domain-containing protein n=1 Tax=Actinomadura sp. WAC 06369 TaxID=2203193 RepID=UPI0018F4FEDC|nr:AraC family ligand binding domain-containing protein [Actinomadura sp. WAC 06369]